MNRKEHKTFEIILNLIIVIFTVIGIILMLTSEAEEGALQSSGIENFKFYTVLTNVFCGIVASVFLVVKILKKDFHLLLPVTAMIEFIFIRRKKIPFKFTVFAAIPTLLYGIGYLLNILINGIGGPWPDTNDFYGFLNWGWPVGIAIFTGIPLTAFAVACLFRAISNKRGE